MGNTLFDGVFLPIDYTQAGKGAFVHALKIALEAKTHLRMLHVDPPKSEEVWGRFPKVRETVMIWEGLDHVATEEDLRNLGLGVRKMKMRGNDPVAALTSSMEKHPDQMLVLAPRARHGMVGMLRKSVSTSLMQQARGLALFVPEGCKGFVNAADGSLSIDHILFPVDTQPDPKLGLEVAEKFCQLLGVTPQKGTLLHVGLDASGMPLDVGTHSWHWERIFREGEPAETILDVAAATQPDLMVMPTEGRTGFLDALRGSVTERVVRHAPCPVLTVYGS